MNTIQIAKIKTQNDNVKFKIGAEKIKINTTKNRVFSPTMQLVGSLWYSTNVENSLQIDLFYSKQSQFQNR